MIVDRREGERCSDWLSTQGGKECLKEPSLHGLGKENGKKADCRITVSGYLRRLDLGKNVADRKSPPPATEKKG